MKIKSTEADLTAVIEQQASAIVELMVENTVLRRVIQELELAQVLQDKPKKAKMVLDKV